MGSEWTESTLGDVAKVQSGFAFKSGDMGETGHPVIKIKNINPPDVDVADVQRVPASVIEGNPRIEKFRLGKGDILIAMTGATVGKVGRMPTISEPHYLNQRVGKVFVTDESAADEDYVYYVLSQDGHVDQMLGLADGSAQPNISGTQIESLEVPLPPLPEQKAIAHILGTLDDKIELNRRTNATLEGMAQALFKSWFVDFDPVIDNALAAGNPIPDELAPRAEVRKNALASSGEHSRTNATTQQGSPDHPTLPDLRSLFPDAFEFTEELGWIPEGWKAKKIEDCISRFSAGKKYSQKTAEDGGCVPILDQGKSGIIGYHNDEPGVKASTDDPIIVFANHTCYMRLIQFDFSAIQNVLPYKGDGMNIYWIYEATKGRQDFIEYKGHWPDFVLNRIVVPTIDLVDVFGDVVEGSYRKIYANTLENEGLTKLRDTLLPKLISGELRISEAEQLTEEALNV